jgi:hypothetical protein
MSPNFFGQKTFWTKMNIKPSRKNEIMDDFDDLISHLSDACKVPSSTLRQAIDVYFTSHPPNNHTREPDGNPTPTANVYEAPETGAGEANDKGSEEEVESFLHKSSGSKTKSKAEKPVYEPCAYIKKKTAKAPGGPCGKNATNTIDGKYYCGNKREDGTYTAHMGVMTKAMAKKKPDVIAKAKKEMRMAALSTNPLAQPDKGNAAKKAISADETKKLVMKILAKNIPDTPVAQDKLSVCMYTDNQGITYYYNPTHMIAINQYTNVAYAGFDSDYELVPLTDHQKEVLEQHKINFDPAYFDSGEVIPVADLVDADAEFAASSEEEEDKSSSIESDNE